MVAAPTGSQSMGESLLRFVAFTLQCEGLPLNFSDLAVASVLSAFGNDHDITEPKDIPDYLSWVCPSTAGATFC